MEEKLSSKVLVTGAFGMVGSYVDFGIKLDRRALDVADPKEVDSVFDRYQPKVVLHLAAETDVDRCERDPEYAYMTNSIGTFNVASSARRIGAKVVYISTVYVFDGVKGKPYLENDRPSPNNHYGRSKYLGELAVRDILDDYLIVRAGWMFGGGPKKDQKFVAKIIKQLQKDEIKAVNDKFGSLTYAKDLVSKIKGFIENDKKGIVHAMNEGSCSRYDIALEIKKTTGSESKIIPVDSSYFNLDASRSNCDIMESLNGGAMRPWQEALDDYVKGEWIKQ
ncbi:NAD(P)-dependent oxidoreductase [Patescibacteria group bacterium]|nr:NAD(P)-dependent oxidoreductase [Patescibacteria group bacterium]